MRDRLTEIGLREARIDKEGNCVAFRPGRSLSPLLVVSAHLDTVFPAGTDCTVRRDSARLWAPGISDDGCGLAALIALARALELVQIETRGSLLFVGTVGEEGAGNLRGVRHLLTAGEWSNRVDAFLSFDGPGVERITNGALGSRRYRVALAGRADIRGVISARKSCSCGGPMISRLASYPAPRNPAQLSMSGESRAARASTLFRAKPQWTSTFVRECR